MTTDNNNNKGRFQEIGEEVGTLVESKNAAYGNSFGKVADFLKILWPEGIPVESYTDALCTVRMFDKLMRIANNKDAFGESPYRDIAGYAILGVEKDERLAKLELAKKNASEVDRQKGIESDFKLYTGIDLEKEREELFDSFEKTNEKYKKLSDVLIELMDKKLEVCIKTVGPLGETKYNTINRFGKISSVNYKKEFPYSSAFGLLDGYFEFATESIIGMEKILEVRSRKTIGIDYEIYWRDSERLDDNVQAGTTIKEIPGNSSYEGKLKLNVAALDNILRNPDEETKNLVILQSEMDKQGVSRPEYLDDNFEQKKEKEADSFLKEIEERTIAIQNWLNENVQNPTADEVTVWQTINTIAYVKTGKLEKLLKKGDIVRFKDVDPNNCPGQEYVVSEILDNIIKLTMTKLNVPIKQFYINAIDENNFLQKKMTIKFKSEAEKLNWYELANSSTATPDQVVDKLIDMYKLQTEETVLARAKEQKHDVVGSIEVDSNGDDAVCSDHD